MSLKHAVRPPSQSGFPPSLLRSSTSLSGSALSISAASSRPSTSYPIVTPQFDNSSLYSASVSDFTSSIHHGGYDHAVISHPATPFLNYHDNNIPSTIYINQETENGGEGDVSIASSAWSSIELDDFSEMLVVLFILLLFYDLFFYSFFRDPLHVTSISTNDSRRSRKDKDRKRLPQGRDNHHSSSSSQYPPSTSSILSPVRVPSARKTRPHSPSGYYLFIFFLTFLLILASSPFSLKSSHHLTSPSQYHNRVERSVDAMSTQSIPSSQSLDEILQPYRINEIRNNHNRKWLQSR